MNQILDCEQREDKSYYMNVREFANGTVEAVLKTVRPMQMDQAKHRYESHGAFSAKHGRLDDLPDETDSDLVKQQNHNRAVRRAKQSIRFCCKQMQADRLFTLTYRENIQDRERVRADFQNFLRRVRKVYPAWDYVAVLERQERGAYHIHCAVVGWQRVGYLRSCWYKALGGTGNEVGADTPGAVNITSPQKRWGAGVKEWKTEKLAGYLTKYLHKTFEQSDAEKRRFWKSKGVQAPKPERFWVAGSSMYEAIPSAYETLVTFFGVKPDFDMWLSSSGDCFWLSGNQEPL